MNFVGAVLEGKLCKSDDPNVQFVQRIAEDVRTGTPPSFHGKMRVRDVEAILQLMNTTNFKSRVQFDDTIHDDDIYIVH